MGSVLVKAGLLNFFVEIKYGKKQLSRDLTRGKGIFTVVFLYFFTIDEFLLARYSWRAFK